MDALTAAGVDATRGYADKLSGTSTGSTVPASQPFSTMPARGDAIVVVGIDRLGRNASEVMTTLRQLGERGIVLRSLREGEGSPSVGQRRWISRKLPSLNGCTPAESLRPPMRRPSVLAVPRYTAC